MLEVSAAAKRTRLLITFIRVISEQTRNGIIFSMAFELLIKAEEAKTLDNGVTTSPVFRSTISDGEVLTDLDGSRTIFEIFTRSCNIYATRPLHGKREKYTEDKVGDYIWETYA